MVRQVREHEVRTCKHGVGIAFQILPWQAGGMSITALLRQLILFSAG